MINEKPDAPASTDTPSEAAATPAAPPAPTVTFHDFGLSKELLDVLDGLKFTKPTPIQAKSIPITLKGTDLIASAQTGTGKTLAFLIPMIEHFKGREGTFGLVLAPTREIANQIQEVFESVGKPLGLRSMVLIGGVGFHHDAAGFASYPHLIVATPGRLCDHLDRGSVWLDYIEIVVLDEADRMLDMGFATQLNRVFEDLPGRRQTLLFSATIPKSVEALAAKILWEPERITIGVPLSTVNTVEQRLVYAEDRDDKKPLLRRLLREEKGSVIIFTRSKDEATQLFRSLHSRGFFDVTFIHSDRLQKDREQALEDFKAGKARILIATDVAARGLHIEGVAHVINYDLPMEAESYVHRIGRTGRAGMSGVATTIATHTSRDKELLHDIEKMIGKAIPLLTMSGRGGGYVPRTDAAAPKPAHAPRAKAEAGAPSADGKPAGKRRGRRGGRGRNAGGASAEGAPPLEPRTTPLKITRKDATKQD